MPVAKSRRNTVSKIEAMPDSIIGAADARERRKQEATDSAFQALLQKQHAEHAAIFNDPGTDCPRMVARAATYMPSVSNLC